MKQFAQRLVIYASGAGSNAAKLIAKSKEIKDITIQAVVSDKSTAPVLQIAADNGIATHVLDATDTLGHLQLHRNLQTDWLLLAGYMRILPPEVLQFFQDRKLGFYRVANIHPSLLPAFAGLNAKKKSFLSGVKVAGVTVHLVDEGVDTGKIMLQESFCRHSDMTFSDFCRKLQEIEHRIYPIALEAIAKKMIRLEKIPGHSETITCIDGEIR